MELYEQPANLFVAGFIGDANLLDAELVAVEVSGMVRLGRSHSIYRARFCGGPVSSRFVRKPFRSTRNPDGTAFGRTDSQDGLCRQSFRILCGNDLGVLFVIDRAKAQAAPTGSKTWITFAERNVSMVPT